MYRDMIWIRYCAGIHCHVRGVCGSTICTSYGINQWHSQGGALGRTLLSSDTLVICLVDSYIAP